MLIQAQAFADAQSILTGARATTQASDPGIALLLAQALVGQGQVAKGQSILEEARQANPDDGEINLAMGDLQRKLEQWPTAASAYREARKHLAAGGESWWKSTLGLAECMVREGNIQAAKEIMRVAAALYRNSAPAAPLPRIDAVLRETDAASTGLDGQKG